MGPWNGFEEEEPGIQIPFRDEHLNMLVSRVINLKELRLRCAHLLTDESVGPALAKYPNLELLDVAYCPLVTNVSFSRFTGTKPRVLDANFCRLLSDFSLVPILKANPRLIELGLNNETQVTDKSLNELISNQTCSFTSR